MTFSPDPRSTTRSSLTTAALAVVLAASASADVTNRRNPPGHELSHAAILAGIYSPSSPWVQYGARVDGNGQPLDLSNGLLSAVRVDDFGLDQPLNVVTSMVGETDDQVWTGGPITGQARARYAQYSQEFGYVLGGGPFVSMFNVSGTGLAVSGSASVDFLTDDLWRWGRRGNEGNTFYSSPADNGDELDHMVTYRVDGVGDGLNHWMVFWEDIRGGGDRDYNDLAVEITATPEPATLTLLLAGAGVALRRAARRRG